MTDIAGGSAETSHSEIHVSIAVQDLGERSRQRTLPFPLSSRPPLLGPAISLRALGFSNPGPAPAIGASGRKLGPSVAISSIPDARAGDDLPVAMILPLLGEKERADAD